MRALVAVLTIAVGVGVVSGGESDTMWLGLLDRAESLSEVGDLDSAGVVLDMALSEATTAYAKSDTTKEIEIYRDGGWQSFYLRSYEEAEFLFTRALRIRERAGGQDILQYAQALMDLAVIHQQQRKYAEALPLYEQALEVREETLGPDHADVGRSLAGVGQACALLGHKARAESLYTRGLSVLETAMGENHSDVGRAAKLLGRLYRSQGRYAEAQPLFERNLSIAEQSADGEDLDTAIAVAELAILHAMQGDSFKAVELYERELAVRMKVQGPEHVSVAQTFNNMAIEARKQGRLDECESLNMRALAIREKVYGPDHTEVAESYSGLGILNWQLGKYAEAETFLKDAHAIYEKALGSEHLEVGRGLSYLGILYSTQGRYAEAEPLYEKSLAIIENQLGPEHHEVADQLNNLANLYSDQMRYAEAESLYKRAMAILEKTVGRDDFAFGESMSNLAIAYAEQGRYSESEPLDKWVIAFYENALGPDHPYVALSLEHLASSYKDQGRYGEAEPLYQRAITIVESAYGPEHPDLAVNLNNLANLYMLQARYAEADSLVTRSLALNRMVLGPDNYNTAIAVESMSRLRRLQNRPAEAVEFAAEALRIRLANFHDNALVLSESDALIYSWNLRHAVNIYLTSCFDLGSLEGETGTGMADVVFSTKGQVSDGIFERQRALVEDTDSLTLALAEDLRYTKFQLSEFFIYGPGDDVEGYKSEVDALSKRAKELEADLSRRSVSFRKREEYRDVDTERIASLLPGSSVLIEYVKYDYLEHNLERVLPRYMAVVARPGREPVVLDIGKASDIDALVEGYRTHMLAVSASGRPPTVIDQQDYRRICGDLYERIWKPLDLYLGSPELVLIAGDGALNMISFAGLLDDEGMYLVEKHPVHYLSSGRDLIRLMDEVVEGTGLFALGDPDYDSVPALIDPVEVAAAHDATEVGGFTVRSARSGPVDLRDLALAPLPGTRNEVEQIAEAWTQTTDDPAGVYLGNEAGEDRFKADAPGNKVIHLATHGYFLEGVDSDEGYVGENPLLLSGLFLAGANVRDKASGYTGAEDGILTAYEVSAMDLTGTDMVVLSACETGLGKVEEGEGVYGLRRAFQMAGARTVISALWPVSDRETANLMGDLYGRAGESIPETMQRIQKSRIEAIRESDLADHPYTWAGFLALGDWK